MPTKILAVVGPTAVGKSALAMRLASAFDGEIIGADSRQVYQMMDIGTAKPTPADRAAIPHHIVDIIAPDEPYSLALFLRDAKQAIQNAKSYHRLPIIVGGTGQYIRALLEGWQLTESNPNAKLRARLAMQAESEGHQRLHDTLKRLDPDTAERIDARNVRRVVRALEAVYTSGGRSGVSNRRVPPNYDALVLGLTMERKALYARIDARIDAQIQQGWLDETRRLIDAGYGAEHPSMSGLGYAELTAHLNGKLPLADAVERIKTRTHRYVRQQYNWFRLSDERIRWHDAPPNFARIRCEVAHWLNTPNSDLDGAV